MESTAAIVESATSGAGSQASPSAATAATPASVKKKGGRKAPMDLTDVEDVPGGTTTSSKLRYFSVYVPSTFRVSQPDEAEQIAELHKQLAAVVTVAKVSEPGYAVRRFEIVMELLVPGDVANKQALQQILRDCKPVRFRLP